MSERRFDAAAIGLTRRVVFHADDFGLNAAVTDGILRGFEDGLLTSTSLMSNAPDAERALQRWQLLESRRRAGGLTSDSRRRRLNDPATPFDLGVHLNLTQGRPMIGRRFPAELLGNDGCFPGIFVLFRRLQRCSRLMLQGIEEELNCQVQFLVDRGLHPTHLNGHQYIEMLPAISPIVESLLEHFGIKSVRVAWEPTWRRSLGWPGVRATQWLLGGVKKYYAGRFRQRMSDRKMYSADAFFGTMTAGATTAATIRALLAATQASPLVEIGLHPANQPGSRRPATEAALPADRMNDDWHDPLAAYRPRELEMLVSAELEEHLAAQGCGLGRLNADCSRSCGAAQPLIRSSQESRKGTIPLAATGDVLP